MAGMPEDGAWTPDVDGSVVNSLAAASVGQPVEDTGLSGGPALEDPAAMPPDVGGMSVQQVAEAIFAEMRKAVVGQDDMVEMLAVALFANGHVLLEGVPGTAKTLAVRSFARICDIPFARIQFTPDLMPSDVIGTNVFDPSSASFRLRKGPIFTGLLLADEVNRTPPKTQAALLEAMEERRVTIDGEPYPLPAPFLVCATQNPIEYEGTYPLPEAQLDRFMLKVSLDYPSVEEETAVLTRYHDGFRAMNLDTAGLRKVVRREDLPALRAEVDAVQVSLANRRYIVDIARAVRESRHVTLGPSPRASVLLMLASRALAAIRGRNFVTPDDVKDLSRAVFGHRVLLRPDSEIEGHTVGQVIDAVLEQVPVPR